MIVDPTYLNLAEASTHLNLPLETLRRWIKKGLVQANPSGQSQPLYSLQELERLAQTNRNTSTGGEYKILKVNEPTPYTAIELFSGAGGLALGLEHAGLNSKLLVEFDKYAAATLRANRGDTWNIIEGDVHDVSFKEYESNIDIVAGGFPCQAFSYAGQGEGFGDARGTLFFEFARCIAEVRPKIALAENVRGLLTHDGGRTLQTMILELEKLGYRVKYKLLRAQFLDVPQKRERLLIIAIRNDLDMPFLFPRERGYTISLRKALEGVPESEGTKYSKAKKDVLDLVPPGGYWRDLPEEVQRKYMGGSYHLSGGKTGMARRLSWDEPSLTLTCSPAQKQTERCHPEETRPLTVREYARIQTFPDDWKFEGGITSQYKQIGNAVPVNLGYYIGLAAVGMLSGEWDDSILGFG